MDFKTVSPMSLASFWRTPLGAAVLVFVLIAGTAALSIKQLHRLAVREYDHGFRESLERLAAVAASQLDGNTLITLHDPAQESGEAYDKLVRPLRAIQAAAPSVAYIYTLTLDGEQVRFVVDAALPGDKDGDGQEDHSSLWDPYDTTNEAMLASLKSASPTICDEPYTDEWGTFLTAYHPIFATDGRLAGVVGVDCTLTNYQAAMAAMSSRGFWAMLPALGVAAAAAIVVSIGRVIAERERARREAAEKQALVLQENLAEASRRALRLADAKASFVSSITHELRTPMVAILGYIDLLQDPGIDEACKKGHIATVRRNSEHLLTVINDLLDYSKIEAGKMNFERLPVSPREVVKDATVLMEQKVVAKGLEFVVEGLDQLPLYVATDPTRVRQVLLNLLSNATKFTSKGSITLRAGYDPASSTLAFSVIDTGIGMSPDQLARLFGAYTQADESTARRFGGTGLGLNISKKLANGLGGDLTATSTQGVGSTFTLAVHAEITAAPTNLGTAVQRSLDIKGTVVLLADDAADNRKLLAHHLSKAGVQVLQAEDGAQALDILATPDGAEVSVILMDMEMPIVDGYEATRRLRRGGERRPIIALTAHSDESALKRCLDAGCDSVASKPIKKDALLAIIADAAPRGRSKKAA